MNVNISSHDVRNPISGCTRDEEIAIARAIGGRLPFDAWESQKNRRRDRTKKIARFRRARKEVQIEYE